MRDKKYFSGCCRDRSRPVPSFLPQPCSDGKVLLTCKDYPVAIATCFSANLCTVLFHAKKHSMDNNLMSAATPKVASLMNDRKYDEAIELLSNGEPIPDAEKLALLGLAYFHSEQYDKATEAFEKALALSPDNEYLKDMLRHAKGNHISNVHVPIPDVYYFDREKLLSKPIVTDGAYPQTPVPAPPPASLLKKIKIKLGNGIGHVSTATMEVVTKGWGKFAGYSGEIWTNWYRRPLMLGILTLAYMREKMNKHNLVSAYPKDVLVGFQPEGQTPPEEAKYYRTADGSWNNLSNPKEGAAGTRFSKNVSLDAARPETGEKLLTPSPRELSRHLLTRGKEMKEVPFLNMLAACWIQFMNHDWINHGENALNDLIEIPLAADDPARQKFWQTKMLVPRTQHDPTRMDGKETSHVSFINEVTHWWDASQVYGSNQETQDRLRTHVDGKLHVNADGTLPIGKNGIEQTGFVRNWWIGLSMLHTLFTREHNAICDHLKKRYADWDDNKLFNVARLINAAITAKIHSVEWTPAILPNPGLDMALNANWYGVLTNLFEKGVRKTVADINVENPELGGVVGNPINKHNSHYALTQEFVEVYRLHSLLPEDLHLKKVNDDSNVTKVPFVEVRQTGSPKISKKYSFADLFYSFGTQHPGQLVLNNYPKFMQELSIPFNPMYDLGAADLLRARERGVPRYNEFRRQLGLKPIIDFEDLTDDQEVIDKLKALYNNDVEMLDLMIGTLAEGHRPDGFGFGETMFQIFILNATRRLQADRFYTDCYNEKYYTKEGLDWIDKTDLKAVILRHYPELASTGLGNIRNAFEPWDTGRNLDPERHPLRKWNRDVKNNPWKGDAY